MSDLSKLSDDELLRLYHATPEPKPAPGAAPAADLSKMSDADLMKLHASFTDAPSSGEAGDGAAAIGRGIIDGVPVVGPYLTAGVNKAVAGVRALQHDTKYSDELRNVENFGRATAAEQPGDARADRRRREAPGHDGQAGVGRRHGGSRRLRVRDPDEGRAAALTSR